MNNNRSLISFKQLSTQPLHFAALALVNRGSTSASLVVQWKICHFQFGTTLAMLFLATFGHNRAALYFGTSMAGVFISSTYPMVISVVKQRANHVSQTAISFIVVAAAIGETLYPVLVGHLFDSYGWSVFLIFGSVTCAGMIVASLVLRQCAFKRSADHSDQRPSSAASFTSGDDHDHHHRGNQWKLPLLEASKRPSKVYQTATVGEQQ